MIDSGINEEQIVNRKKYIYVYLVVDNTTFVIKTNFK